jgi:3-dehydroquinate synthase
MEFHSVSVDLGEGRGYPIVIGAGVRRRVSEFVRGKNVVVITAPALRPLCDFDFDATYLMFEPGESHKNLETVSVLLDRMLALKLERGDCVIAFGGGIVGDVAGFVASIYLRGITFIQMPTTLLAQVDAAIGGKTGVNHRLGKNLIGSFYQPVCVLSDVDMLKTLPKREVLCGLAEVVKYGVIHHPTLFDYLECHANFLSQLDVSERHDVWTYLITESSKEKAFVVSCDEKESGLRETLNFGHTLGHAIESSAEYDNTYLHGEAVAIGMVAATRIAVKMGICSIDVLRRLESLLESLGFPLRIQGLSCDVIMEKLKMDKKVRQSQLRFILPTDIGTVVTRSDVSEALIRDVVKEMS